MKIEHTIKYLVLLLLIFCTTSCDRSIKFDSETWQTNHDDFIITDSREKMLKDLINSKLLLDKNLDEIITQIGRPSPTSDSEKVKFLVREKYGSNIDPVYMKYLVIEFDEYGKSISQTIEQTQ